MNAILKMNENGKKRTEKKNWKKLFMNEFKNNNNKPNFNNGWIYR